MEMPEPKQFVILPSQLMIVDTHVEEKPQGDRI